MSSSEVHYTHPNADTTQIFRGFGAFKPKEDVKPLAYNPPKLREDFVEIQISHCGICGSDIHTIDSGWGPTNYPVIVGHEIVGKVVNVGSAVTHLKVGDRVGVGAQCGSCLNKEKNCQECAVGAQQHCRVRGVFTYNSKYEDGQVSQGGYADRVRCSADFTFKIPEAISSAEAAPLMCGGVTVFAPLKRYMTRKDMKVGVVGIGGLGHLGVMFASKLAESLGGGTITAISTSSKKKEEALKMGAHKFIDTSDKAQIQAAFREFDLILSTANGSDMAMNEWLSMVAYNGVFCTVGLPEEPFNIRPFSLLSGQKQFVSSLIGSIDEIKEMLEFASKYNVRPIIERIPMEKVNEGIQKVRDGSVRYRVVLENPTQ